MAYGNIQTDQILKDVTFHLVGGDLTTDGVQYSDVKETDIANADVTIFEITLELGEYKGNIIEVYFNLVANLKAQSATANLKMKMQFRNSGGTWQDLFPQVTYNTIGTSYLDEKYEGRIVKAASAYCTPSDSDFWTYVSQVPSDFRVLLQSNESAAAGGRGYGRLKNASQVRVIYIGG